MPHYRALLDPGLFIGPQDFPTEKTITIARVVREAMPKRDDDKRDDDKRDDDKPDSAPMIYFAHKGQELPRKYKAPKSVLYGLSLAFGTDTDGWIGKEVTLFAAKCMSFGEIEECVRIRFAPEIDGKIRKWLKKRKANQGAYMIGSAA